MRVLVLPTSVVLCDNQSVIALILKHELSSRSRHTRTHLGFIYEVVDSGDIRIEYIRSALNPANTLTTTENRDRGKLFSGAG